MAFFNSLLGIKLCEALFIVYFSARHGPPYIRYRSKHGNLNTVP